MNRTNCMLGHLMHGSSASRDKPPPKAGATFS